MLPTLIDQLWKKMIKQLRLGKGLSQAELAQMAGISVRTLQRVENGEAPSLETSRALASVLEVSLDTIRGGCRTKPELQRRDAVKHVKRLRDFYIHLSQYVVVMCLLLAINLITSPYYYWVVFPFLGWGVGIMFHAAQVFEWLPARYTREWERKELEKYLTKR